MFNSEKYIAQTIESVISQTYKNWEMIIVDDYSSDTSSEIAKHFVAIDKRIRLIMCDAKSENGPIDVRNRAIKEARGQYIAFLDSDDYWDSNKLEKQIMFMKSNDVAFSYSDFRVYGEKKKKVMSIHRNPPKMSYRDLCKTNRIGCLTVVYNAEKLGKILMVDAPKREDYATWLFILKKVDFAYNVGECLATYRVHNKSFSSNKITLIKYHWRVYRINEKMSFCKSLYFILHTILHKLLE